MVTTNQMTQFGPLISLMSICRNSAHMKVIVQYVHVNILFYDLQTKINDRRTKNSAICLPCNKLCCSCGCGISKIGGAVRYGSCLL